MKGGELFQHLRKHKRFSESIVKFYVCELVLALEYLHNRSIIYRDLKPENILLDEQGHLCLTDFGMSKFQIENKTFTICGTPEYLAPETIKELGHDHMVDWWALGIVIFELLYGMPPFIN